MRDFKDFLDFIAEGDQPYWKIKEYKAYLKTLPPLYATEYFLMTKEWIKEKGENRDDREFLFKMSGMDRSRKNHTITMGTAHEELNEFKEELLKWREKYIAPDDSPEYWVLGGEKIYSSDWWIACIAGHFALFKNKAVLTLHKRLDSETGESVPMGRMKVNPNIDSFEMIMDFVNIFNWFAKLDKDNEKRIPLHDWYSNKAAASYLYQYELRNMVNGELLSLSTIEQYIRRRKRKG